MAETKKVKYVPEVVWVVYDDGNDRALCACHVREQAEAIAKMYDDGWVNVHCVPVVCPLGEWQEVENG